MQEIYSVHMLVLISYLMKFCSALTAAFYVLQLTSIKSSAGRVKILLLAAPCIYVYLLTAIGLTPGGSSTFSSFQFSSVVSLSSSVPKRPVVQIRRKL